MKIGHVYNALILNSWTLPPSFSSNFIFFLQKKNKKKFIAPTQIQNSIKCLVCMYRITIYILDNKQDKQANRQTDKQTNRQTDGLPGCHGVDGSSWVPRVPCPRGPPGGTGGCRCTAAPSAPSTPSLSSSRTRSRICRPRRTSGSAVVSGRAQWRCRSAQPRRCSGPRSVVAQG